MESRTVKNTPGMFDVFKGFMMIAIMLGHSFGTFYHYWDMDFSGSPLMVIVGLFISFTAHGAVPVFFMICGYGIRKMTVKSSLKKQLGYLLLPYLLIALTVALATVARAIMAGESIWERLEFYVVPYLLAYCGSGTTIFGLHVNTIGPVWFVWVYFIGTIAVNLILQEERTWMQIVFVAILGLFGVCLRETPLPFCLHQVAVCTGYLYFGWLIKKTKFLQKEVPSYFWWVLFAAGLILSSFGEIEISMNAYGDGATDLLVSYLCGFLFMYLCVKLNSLDNGLWHAIAWVGRKALIICCLHTVTYIAFPWATVVRWMGERRLLGVALSFAFHFAFAIGGALVLDAIKQKRAKKFTAKTAQ